MEGGADGCVPTVRLTVSTEGAEELVLNELLLQEFEK